MPTAMSLAISADPPSQTSLSPVSSPAKQSSPSPTRPLSPQQAVSVPHTPGSSLSDVLHGTFSPFDHQAVIVIPFNHELNQDTVFVKELSAMLLDAILETHAWATARPKHETSLAAQQIEQKIVAIMETEKQQDKTRQQLNQFVSQVKTALAALTGLIEL